MPHKCAVPTKMTINTAKQQAQWKSKANWPLIHFF